MKIQLLAVGKTASAWMADGIDMYVRRIRHYCPFELRYVADVKGASLSQAQQKRQEGQRILSMISDDDRVVLLDERGVQPDSRGLAAMLERRLSEGGVKTLWIVIGGPYGFDQDVYRRADAMVSLSKLTLPHDLARLMALEQIYRAFTIINGLPYHHD